MESLYKAARISRQGFHQHRNKKQAQEQKAEQIVARVQHHRQNHPRMGARTMLTMLRRMPQEAALLDHIGRDAFEEILMNNGLRVEPIRVFHKTTYSGAFRFPNLVEGLQVKDLNHIWISDLTYYRLMDKWGYLTFILDLYSRRCLGYALSDTLHTEQTTIPALQMALKTRGISDYNKQLVFHSDGGGQFYDKTFLTILEQHKIVSSMAVSAYENPHMERFHSTAKNDYLIPWKINSFDKLRKSLPIFIELYNVDRPHKNLKKSTPVAFEDEIQQIPLDQRPFVLFKKIT